MGRRRICLFTAVLLMAGILTGCWDKVEIEQRGFVGVIAVDMAPPGNAGKEPKQENNNSGAQKTAGSMIKVTYIFANPANLPGGGGGGGGGSGPAYTSLSSTGVTIDETNRNVDAMVSSRLFFGFTQVVIFGEELMKNPDRVKEVIDYFRRNPDFSRSVRVLVADGEASKVADTKPKGETLISSYIRGILDNEVSNGKISDITFNEYISMAETLGEGIMPEISIEKEDVKISGLALIKDYKLLGYLSPHDSQYFNTLKGIRHGGSESIQVDGYTLDFAVRDISRKVQMLNDDPKAIEVGINMKIEGSIISADSDKEIYDTQLIKKIEDELDKQTTESCSTVINELQKEYKLDALEIDEYIMKFHPGLWEKVKDNWAEIYPNIRITPIAINQIRRVGTVK